MAMALVLTAAVIAMNARDAMGRDIALKTSAEKNNETIPSQNRRRSGVSL